MKTKTAILSIAIIAALPFSAMAGYTYNQVNTPARVANNGTVDVADNGPYQTATIGEHDDEHIATTAYVKGAYNDAIAAVNKVDNSKQVKLKSFNAANGSEQDIEPKVMGSGFNGVGANLILQNADEYAEMAEDIAHDLTGESNNAAALNDTLISAGTVMQWMREAGDAINTKADASDLNNKRVTIYTTWGNDTSAATTQVPFTTAQ